MVKVVQGALDKLAKFKSKNGDLLSDEQYNLLFKLLKAGEKKAVRTQEATKYLIKAIKQASLKLPIKSIKNLTMGVENPLISKRYRIIPQSYEVMKVLLKEMEAMSSIRWQINSYLYKNELCL